MKLRLSPREKGVGQGEALRKTEQRGDMSKGVCVWRVEVGGGEEKRENKRYQDRLRLQFRLLVVEAL